MSDIATELAYERRKIQNEFLGVEKATPEKRVLAVGRVQTQTVPGFRTQVTFHVHISRRFEGESVGMNQRQINIRETK